MSLLLLSISKPLIIRTTIGIIIPRNNNNNTGIHQHLKRRLLLTLSSSSSFTNTNNNVTRFFSSSSSTTTTTRNTTTTTTTTAAKKNANNNNNNNNDNTNDDAEQQQPLVTFHIDTITTTPCLKKYGADNLHNKIGTITINSPKTYNALTMDIGIQFKAVCEEIIHELHNNNKNNKSDDNYDDDTSLLHAHNIQAIVVTGAGNDAFSSGGNLEWLQSLRNNPIQTNIDLMKQFYNYFHTIRQIPVPIIAALNGPAMGAGACLALACDLRTACKTKTKLGLHFTRLGIHSGMGGYYLLQNALGGPNAIINEILLLGKILTAQECYDYKIVNRLHETDAKVAAYELAAEIVLKTNPVAIRIMLQTLRNQQDIGLNDALIRDAITQAVCYNQNDWGEGLSAIAEKRDPKFDKYHK